MSSFVKLMKTTLPKRSLIIKERLDAILKEILAVGKKEISMVVLFGSYARGTWVSDSYVEGHITYSYQSDLDIMIVTKSLKYAGYQGISLQQKIEERLERAGLDWRPFLAPPVTLIIEPIELLNEKIETSRYFYLDIRKEGIMLYDSGEFTLAEAVEAKDLSWEKRKEMAIDDYNQWFPNGDGFLIDTGNAFGRNDFNKSAFYLHQATESFYNTILLVFTGYKKKLHDIEILGSLASNYSNELLKIFPRDTAEQKECFILLQKAYIDARYNKNYKITEEQLLYLIKRVEKLKAVTEEICQAWIKRC